MGTQKVDNATKSITRGVISEACRLVGLKSRNPYYDALKRLEKGEKLSITQSRVMAKVAELTKD